jgi:hypothetical protein
MMVPAGEYDEAALPAGVGLVRTYCVFIAYLLRIDCGSIAYLLPKRIGKFTPTAPPRFAPAQTAGPRKKKGVG